MPVNAKVIAHSRAESTPDLITLQVRFPWWLLPEMNTHRAFSRNYGSTRAIPISKLIDEANNDPALPYKWTSHRPGMQGGDDLSREHVAWAQDAYLEARDHAVQGAKALLDLGIAKQNANRLLMPFIHVEGIVTATEWQNFFDLRCHPDAEPTMRALAEAMRDAIESSEPDDTETNWHLPYLQKADWGWAWEQTKVGGGKGEGMFPRLAMISAARCARVSYLNHDGTNANIEKDMELARRLLDSKHMSPFEHQAQADPEHLRRCEHANFTGWVQFRQMVAA